MKIEIGLYIKIFCQNGLVEAGKLLEHTDQHLVIELIDKSRMVVQKPYDNILAIKVFVGEKESREKESVFVDNEPEPDKYYSKEDLRAKNLAELHKMKAQEERNRAVELLRSHQPKEISEVQFGTPNFNKPISNNPKKKVRRNH